MIKGQDVVVLLYARQHGFASTQALADATGLSGATVHRALRRLADARLFDRRRGRVPAAPAEEFLVHAVKYVFPPVHGGEARGVPTAWGAPPLSSEIAHGDVLPPIWPYARGDRRGLSLEPLHPVVPEIAVGDPALWELFALVDAIRAGDARIQGLAERSLHERLLDPATP